MPNKKLKFKTLPVYQWESEGYIAIYQLSQRTHTIYMLDFDIAQIIKKNWSFLYAK